MKRVKVFARAAGFLFIAGIMLALVAGIFTGCGEETTTTTVNADTTPTATKKADKTVDRTTTGAGEAEFKAMLVGGEEVPPLQTGAKGEAEFEVSGDGSTITFKLEVEDISDVTASHIHMAAAGANGPIVVSLFSGSKPGVFDGTLAEDSFTAADLTGPLAGMTLDALIAELKAGNTYVNVHTAANPSGEIRGQIRQK